jgi:hypothetical protein
VAFRYIITPILSSTPAGELELSDVAFNDPSYGFGAAFSANAQITDRQPADQLRSLTEPDSVALYVKDDSTGQYLFGGPVFDRPWDRDSRRLQIKAQSWKSWLYNKLCGMNTSTNPVSDTTFSATNTDQFTIARNILSTFVIGKPGCPAINLGTEGSGVNRDLNFHGSDQKFVGDQIDSMGNRDNGFEWNIEARPSGSKGDPSLWFAPYFPARGGLNNQLLIFFQQETGGNILELSNPTETTADRRTRVWATGAGQPPDQPVAYDEDPNIAAGTGLLRESLKNYNSVTVLSTLADHARAEREYRSQALQSVTLSVSLSDPDYKAYLSGDKIKLLVVDDWINWDFDVVRIIDRTFKLNDSADSPKPDMVQLVVDLNDRSLPEDVAVV